MRALGLRGVLGLLCVLMGTYLLVYVNAPTDADGLAMLAVAANLVQHGRTDMNALGASDWLLLPRGRMGSFGQDGALYAKKGPTPSLFLVPLVALAEASPGLSIRATAALLNVLVTTATAILVAFFLDWLGFRPRTALALAFIYGLATFAIAYVKTLFGEPLVALLLLLAAVGAWRWREDERPRHAWLALAGIALALCVGVNLIYVVLIPIVGLYLGPARLIRHIGGLIAFGLPLLLILALIGLQNWGRFGDPLTSGYQFAAGEGFTYPLLDGLYGTLISPYRGYFWYNPCLILAVPGWWLLRRRSGALAWLLAALIVVQPLLFASWWSWYGGIVWGPRFLLPTLPFAVLCLAPILDRAWSRRWVVVLFGVLVGLSVLIQVLGVLFSYLPYTGYLIAAFSEPIPRWVIADPLLSPVVGHLALVWGGQALDPAWVARGVDWAHLTACLTLIAVGVGILVRRASGRLAIPLALVAVCAAGGVVVTRQQADPSVGRVRELESALTPPALTVAATTLFADSLLDVEQGGRVITMNAPTSPDDDRARRVWQYARRESQRLWLVTWFPPAAPGNWQERDLWQTSAFIREVSAAGHRAVLFDLGPSPAADREAGHRFGAEVRLAAYGTRHDGDGLAVVLRWEALRLVGRDLSWFVHVIDPAGNIIAQQDRQPQGGYAPTRSWQPGGAVADRLYFLLPAGIDSRSLKLRIGVIDPAAGQPLPVQTPAGRQVEESEKSEESEKPFVVLDT
jgi:4-amino-4-deoxy-L-arabinose transferase-like glycosyltransferase